MFPWYTGTSADMYLTIFGLIVSLKLFLGRFDMRTMQARLPPQSLGPSAHRTPLAHRAGPAADASFPYLTPHAQQGAPLWLALHFLHVHSFLAWT